MKPISQTTAFCRPSTGLQSFIIGMPGANAPGYYATAPLRGDYQLKTLTELIKKEIQHLQMSVAVVIFLAHALTLGF